MPVPAAGAACAGVACLRGLLRWVGLVAGFALTQQESYPGSGRFVSNSAQNASRKQRTTNKINKMAFTMKDLRASMACRWLALSLAFALLAACHSGGGGNGDVNVTPGSGSSGGTTAGPTPVYLNGTAAVGLPLEGATVIVKDGALAQAATALTDKFGNFKVNIVGMHAPLVLEVQGVAAGRPVILHSFIPTQPAPGGILNVTPVTNAALALVTGVDPQAYFAGTDYSLLSLINLGQLNSGLTAMLSNVLMAEGLVPTDVNFFTGTLNANRSGLDAVYDLVDVVVLPSIMPSGLSHFVEQVQFINRLDQSQRVTVGWGFPNTSQPNTLQYPAALAMNAAAVARFDFAPLDYLTLNKTDSSGTVVLQEGLNGELAGGSINGTAIGKLFFDTNFLDADGLLAQGYGTFGSLFSLAVLSRPAVESCNPDLATPAATATPTCLVRIGFVLNSSGHNGQQGVLYGTVRFGTGTTAQPTGQNWFFHGNQQDYLIDAHYRFFSPVFPGLTLASPSTVEEGIQIEADFTNKQSASPSLTVAQLDIYTVDPANPSSPLLLKTVSAAELGTASPSVVHYAFPLIQAQIDSINANGGHLRVTATLSDASTRTTDLYLAQAPALGVLPLSRFPTLPMPVVNAFRIWNNATLFNGAAGSPGLLTLNGQADIPVAMLEAEIVGGGNTYPGPADAGHGRLGGPLNSRLPMVAPTGFGIVTPLAVTSAFAAGNPVVSDAAQLNRRLTVSAYDAFGNVYATGYCFGATTSCH
jgi:hypothetical protein